MNPLEFAIALSLGLAVAVRGQFAEKCEFPVKLGNSFVILLNRTEVNYSCREKYTHHSIPLKRCANGQGSRIYCLDRVEAWAQCGYPDHPSNGYIYITMRLTYACNNGFVLLGEADRVCSTQGSWSPPIPKCVKNLAKDIGYTELIDENSATWVTLDGNVFSKFDLKTETLFDGVKIRFKNSIIAWVVAGCATLIIVVIAVVTSYYSCVNRKKPNEEKIEKQEVAIYEEMREVPIYTNEILVRAKEDRKEVPIYSNNESSFASGSKEANEHEYLCLTSSVYEDPRLA